MAVADSFLRRFRMFSRTTTGSSSLHGSTLTAYDLTSAWSSSVVWLEVIRLECELEGEERGFSMAALEASASLDEPVTGWLVSGASFVSSAASGEV
jgi:hypothetical protein